MPESTDQSLPQQALESRPKKKRGFLRTFFRWFFRILLLLIVLGAILVALALRLPQKWGLVKSPAEKAFEATADRSGAEKLLASAKTEGFAAEGTELYLLPIKDSDQNVAYAVFDSSKGFRFGVPAEGGDPMLGALVSLARSQAAKDLKVERVAIEYRDESGKPLVTMTANTAMILDFANKKISREAFIKAVDGRMEIKNVIERSLVSF